MKFTILLDHHGVEAARNRSARKYAHAIVVLRHAGRKWVTCPAFSYQCEFMGWVAHQRAVPYGDAVHGGTGKGRQIDWCKHVCRCHPVVCRFESHFFLLNERRNVGNDPVYGFVQVEGFDNISSMTTMLAIETSGALCSLAIWRDQERFEDTRNVDRMHNQVVLEMLDALTRRAQVAPQDFEVVGFGAGPGSFTGVRIAATVAQSVALAASAVAVPVSSSLALLTAVKPTEGKVLVTTRSRGDAYYIAGYSRQDTGWELVVPDALHGSWPTELLHHDWICVGDRPSWEAVGGAPPWRGAGNVNASHIAELAMVEFESGRACGPAEALPRYVGGDTPWRPV